MTDEPYPLPKAQSMSADEFARLKAVVAGYPTDDELARLEAVARAAAPYGEPAHIPHGFGRSSVYWEDDKAYDIPEDLAKFIAALSPATVLALLAELRDLRTRYNRAYKAIQAWEDGDQFTAGYEVGYNDGESSREADLAARLDP
jgi:hypothetical protein